MSDIVHDIKPLVGTLLSLFDHNKDLPECEILSKSKSNIERIGYDSWNGGTDIYGLYFEVPTKIYATYEPLLEAIENNITEKLKPILRKYPNTWIGEVVISPQLVDLVDNENQIVYKVSTEELLNLLNSQRELMIAVSTGGPRIQTVNDQYIEQYERIQEGLSERGFENPNPHDDLWQWYGKWSSGDLPSYQSRSNYINDLFDSLIKTIRRRGKKDKQTIFTRPTGWSRVDRAIGEIRTRLSQASTEEQFQAIGLLCRETLISVAQSVYNPEKHHCQDEVIPSDTDAKRMLEGFLTAELTGKTNEKASLLAKSALTFASEVVHKRTATFRQAALCAEATSAVVNIVAIISGQRDPQG